MTRKQNQRGDQSRLIELEASRGVSNAEIADRSGSEKRMMRASLQDILVGSARYEAMSYARSDDDREAWGHFAAEAQELAGAPAAAVAQAFWAARWRRDGFPRVVLGPRRAAMLSATGVTSEQMEIVHPPWRAFVVQLWDSPISMPLPDGSRSEIDRIEVHYSAHHTGAPAWSMIAESVAGPSIHRFSVPPAEWLRDKLEHEPIDDGWSSLAVTDEDLRALVVLSRLVAGLCLSLSTPEHREDAARRGRSKGYRQRRRGPPLVRDYVLGDDVRVDVREAISEFVASGGRAPKVQSLVRGHWKMQPHGPQRAQRKWIHVEPYWRGPEDAPILVRRHKLVEG